MLPDSFDAEKYFASSIGILVLDKCRPQIVKFQVFNGRQNYFRTVPIHASQQEYDTEANSSKFSILVQPNNELIQELLRYGEDVIVLSPKWFKKKVEHVINEMKINYQKN